MIEILHFYGVVNAIYYNRLGKDIKEEPFREFNITLMNIL